MKGCLGCLGALLVVAFLAWPIEVLAQLFGWSDAQTGWVLLLVLGLLAIGASRRRAAKRPAPETTLPRRRPASAQREAGWVRRQEDEKVRPAWERPADQVGRPMHVRGERRCRLREDLPATRATERVRVRDPLPAQLRFSILQRDGFRCRYCGRTCSTPGVVLHVDHVVPLAAGGATKEDNLRTACEECNLGKASSLPPATLRQPSASPDRAAEADCV
jgi:5-methylcytosine-specific restriction endonuclease McrA